MLELFVIPRNGNAGGRFFPHIGHLGVTPVVVQGRISTKLPDVCEPLAVKSISLGIRCTETCGNGSSSVLWEKRKVLLTPPDGDEYMSMGDWESSFKTTVPVNAALEARSTMCIPEYKVAWRMEVVIEHKPIPYVGTSITRAFNLNLHNHRSPAVRPMSPPSPHVLGPEGCTANVCISAQSGAFGPGDTFPIKVQVKPLDAGMTVKKATVTLERNMEFFARRSTSPPSSQGSRLSTLFRSSHSPSHQRLAGDEIESHSSRRDRVCEVSSSDIVTDSVGTHWCQLSVSLPGRHGNWDLGETHQTKLVNISYALKANVTVKPAKSRSSRVLTCSPVPIVIAAASTEDRASAANSVDLASKKRHRSSRRGLYMHEGNIEVNDSATQLHSPVLSPIKGVATDVKPILLSSNQQSSQAQSISFVFPSPPPYEIRPITVTSLLNPASSPPPPPTSSTSHLPSPPPTRSGLDPDSLHVWRQFQNTGRRISTTTSEEEDVQPSRSRQRLSVIQGDDRDAQFQQPALPSLDALGLGLPHVPDDGRPRSRPRTAPIHSTFAASIPPPLSGTLSSSTAASFGPRPVTSMARMASTTTTPSMLNAAGTEHSFAFAFPSSSRTPERPPKSP
ncbi:hypothetical protein I316_05039 [Kwoniella heveanensis BCC8398]|uniref:Arrestin C-terminal-like domain-containing protein n=1 Tax=Kwoniella heveanensis BCC8398 TaxID=1296120 RepID=A0A1B9GQP3_9TREE|nr:hypothetical protein I316_05039 [Kwoniella heveanensis BCC8398]